MFEDPSECLRSKKATGSVVDQIFTRSEDAFTLWLKLIARDFLSGWWDKLISRTGAGVNIHAKSSNGIVDGSKVVSLV